MIRTFFIVLMPALTLVCLSSCQTTSEEWVSLSFGKVPRDIATAKLEMFRIAYQPGATEIEVLIQHTNYSQAERILDPDNAFLGGWSTSAASGGESATMTVLEEPEPDFTAFSELQKQPKDLPAAIEVLNEFGLNPKLDIENGRILVSARLLRPAHLLLAALNLIPKDSISGDKIEMTLRGAEGWKDRNIKQRQVGDLIAGLRSVNSASVRVNPSTPVGASLHAVVVVEPSSFGATLSQSDVVLIAALVSGCTQGLEKSAIEIRDSEGLVYDVKAAHRARALEKERKQRTQEETRDAVNDDNATERSTEEPLDNATFKKQMQRRLSDAIEDLFDAKYEAKATVVIALLDGSPKIDYSRIFASITIAKEFEDTLKERGDSFRKLVAQAVGIPERNVIFRLR